MLNSLKYLSFIFICLIPLFGEEGKVDVKEGVKIEKKSANGDEDLVITSKTLNYDHVNRQAVFNDDVKAVNGITNLKADKMTCFFDENNDIYLVIAEGNVVITREGKVATSQKAVYKIPEKIIILSKEPKLNDGTNTITARVITFYEDKKISEFDEPICVFFRKEDKTVKPVEDKSVKKDLEK